MTTKHSEREMSETRKRLFLKLKWAGDDGRSKFTTGRNHQFATRVTEDFHREFKMTAARDGIRHDCFT